MQGILECVHDVGALGALLLVVQEEREHKKWVMMEKGKMMVGGREYGERERSIFKVKE